MNKKLVVISLALAVAGVFAGKTFAGVKYTSAVTVDTVNRHASGSVGGARNSADSTQHIECLLTGYTTGTATASCQAVDASGYAGWCTGTSAAMVATVQSMSSTSDLYFAWDASYNCTIIQVRNASYNQPPTL